MFLESGTSGEGALTIVSRFVAFIAAMVVEGIWGCSLSNIFLTFRLYCRSRWYREEQGNRISSYDKPGWDVMAGPATIDIIYQPFMEY